MSSAGVMVLWRNSVPTMSMPRSRAIAGRDAGAGDGEHLAAHGEVAVVGGQRVGDEGGDAGGGHDGDGECQVGRSQGEDLGRLGAKQTCHDGFPSVVVSPVSARKVSSRLLVSVVIS